MTVVWDSQACGMPLLATTAMFALVLYRGCIEGLFSATFPLLPHTSPSQTKHADDLFQAFYTQGAKPALQRDLLVRRNKRLLLYFVSVFNQRRISYITTLATQNLTSEFFFLSKSDIIYLISQRFF